MVVVVIVGTFAVLRFSYIPVAKQYQAALQRTLQRVAAELDSLDGEIALNNMHQQRSDENGVPVAKLPLEFLSIIPGHAEELRPLRGCSFATMADPDSHLCAGVLENKNYGSVVYLRGQFRINAALMSPTYSKSLFESHHFTIAITAKNKVSRFIATFDPVLRSENYESAVFSPAWSIAGFKIIPDNPERFSREPYIKGRVLAHGSTREGMIAYEFILQVPMYAYMDEQRGGGWPPASISDARVLLKLVGPTNDKLAPVLMDGGRLAQKPQFSFDSMSQYLAPGESLKFTSQDRTQSVDVQATDSPSMRGEGRSLLSSLASVIVGVVTPSITTKKTIQLLNGGEVEINGNPALVLGGWSAAAKAIIAFALFLSFLLIVSGYAFYYFVVAPLSRVRRNTIYMRGRYSDAAGFRLPYSIPNRRDEIGVLWASIEDLHKSITTYGREALERARNESELLRALGHEIKSPLQELLLRHNQVGDPSAKSLQRISYALKTLSSTYSGQSSEKVLGPKEAISASSGNITREDITEYLENAAESSEGIIVFNRPPGEVYVSADGDMLEASLMAILNNAKEFRGDGTVVTLQVFSDLNWVLIHIYNCGPHIPFYPIDEVFEYGVSSRDVSGDHQGLGLFIAKQYINKMGGSIAAKNIKGGVRFEIKLARAH